MPLAVAKDIAEALRPHRLMKKLLIPLPVIAALLVVPSHAASLTEGPTTQASSNNTNGGVLNISVFPGKGGWDASWPAGTQAGGFPADTSMGVFGDGTVVDYRFFDSPAETINSYADGGAGLFSLATSAPENINGAGESWCDLWTTNDPGTNFDTPPPNFANTVNSFARSANITGTIDVSSLTDGTLYFIHGTYTNSWKIALTMSGGGQTDVLGTAGDDPPNGINRGYVTEFTFADAGAYQTITYTYTNTDADGSRARFMGVVLDGEANFGADDTDGDFLLDLWEDEHFGDNSGTVEPSDLTVTDGTGDADLDGATESQEHNAGTDPNVADTDGDGLDDGDEINTHNTDPNVADSDGDSLSDGDEVNTHGTNPTLVDTDGDTLNDDEELVAGADGFVTDPLKQDSDDDGVTDDQDTAPNDASNDSDGDGLSNEDETNTHGTDPLAADTDGDGVDDAEEVAEGADGFITDPLSSDTDGDGIVDGIEVSLGSDPVDVASIPTSGPAGLVAGTTVQVSNNHSDFNLSVFPGSAGYEDLNAVSTPFGDGTVLDYRFFDSPDDALNSYADGEAGLISDSTAAAENVNGAGEHWAVVWTTNDPGADPANFPAPTITFARAQTITGTIDISGLKSGSLYFPHGTYINSWTIALTMSGPGQADVLAEAGAPNGPSVNMAWMTTFAFFNASIYDTITYTYTNTDVDGSRARFMGVILDGVAISAEPIRLSIAANGANLDFEWDSKPGMFYVLRTSSDLAADFATWDSVNVPGSVENNGVFELATNAPLNVHSIVRPGDSVRFYRVEEYPLPPVTVFEDNFDGADQGWTTGFDASDTTMNTVWQMGDPAGAPATGPAAANSAPNCYGTNLTTNYGISSATWLRSPAIDLTTATGATVTFQQWVDMDEFDNLDRGAVRVLDASGLPGTVTELGVVQADITGFLDDWAEFSADLPAAALGQSIVLEFEFVSDDDDIFDATGWYLDDVIIITPAP
jgi:hypothetical protein